MQSISDRTFGLIVLFGSIIFLSGCSGRPIGLHDGRLYPCPNSPNCITSSSTGKNGVEPLRYSGPRKDAHSALVSVLGNMSGARIVTAREDYVHAEFRSSLFRFVDDVEFQLPESPPVIYVRSAARSGYYDFGVNRRRMEQIRSLFQQRMTLRMRQEISPTD